MKKSLCALSVSLLMAGSAWADVIVGESSDGYIAATGAGAQGSGLSINTSLNRARAGNWTGASGQTHTSVFVFQLPDLGAIADPFATVTFSFTTFGITSPDFNADLYGIDARAASTVLTSDYYVGDATDDATDASKLQDSILTSALSSGSFTSVDIASFLNAQYAAGAHIGDYIFLRLNRDGSTDITDEATGYVVYTTDETVVANRPVLNYTLVPALEPIDWIGGAGSADWNEVNNWSSFDLPGTTAANTVRFIGSEDSTTLTSPFAFANAASLTVEDDTLVTIASDLSGLAELSLGGSSAGAGGAIVQSAGAVFMESLEVGATAVTSSSAYTISGGSLTASKDLNVNQGIFALQGSAATVSVDSMTVADLGELSFTLAASGVNPIQVSHLLSIETSTAQLTVDVSAYSGAGTSIELIQYGSMTGSFNTNSITISGLSPEHQPARIVFDADSMNLELGPVSYEPERAAILALGDLTDAPALYNANNEPTTWAEVSAAIVSSGSSQPIYYDGLDYNGNPTRIFAWVGLPSDLSSPVPAMVLAHGGGGTAFKVWVDKWTARGYAAIAMDLEGRVSNASGAKSTNANPGPTRDGIYNNSVTYPTVALPNHWMYHAVADCVLANSLMRSIPEVNADQVGMMGVSWGGIITSTTMGIDTRFMFAIPTYGCGHLYDNYNQYAAALADCELYKQAWDPILRIHRAAMPAMWFSWPQDQHFALDSQAATYLRAPGVRMVTLIPNLGHGHVPAYNAADSYAFANSIIASGSPWCRQQSLTLDNRDASVTFSSTKNLDSAVLITSTGTGFTGDLTWDESAVTPVYNGDGTWTVAATLPEGVTAWFFNVMNGALVASSDYQEIIDLVLDPSDDLQISHPVFESKSSSSVAVAFTAPTNIEISEIRLSDQSHPGGFTNLTEAPLVETNPFPATFLVEIEFDNSVAGLSNGETATASLTLVWEELDGSTDQVELTIRALAWGFSNELYSTWAAGNGLSGRDAELNADPDVDGKVNLLEYALGSSPNFGNPTASEPMLLHNGVSVNYLYPRRLDAAERGLSYTVIANSELSSPLWSTDGITETDTEGLDDDFEIVTTDVPLDDNLFIRLRIDLDQAP